MGNALFPGEGEALTAYVKQNLRRDCKILNIVLGVVRFCYAIALIFFGDVIGKSVKVG
jgi:hypothetical protein